MEIQHNVDQTTYENNLSNLLIEKYESPQYEEVIRKIYLYGTEMKKKYEDWNRYRVFHILIGSTPPPEADRIDFPVPEDSVQSFVEKL